MPNRNAPTGGGGYFNNYGLLHGRPCTVDKTIPTLHETVKGKDKSSLIIN